MSDNKIVPPDDWWLDWNNEILVGSMGILKIGKVYSIASHNDGSANGKFIIKAAKNHDKMLNALKQARAMILKKGIQFEDADVWNLINETITKIEKEE